MHPYYIGLVHTLLRNGTLIVYYGICIGKVGGTLLRNDTGGQRGQQGTAGDKIILVLFLVLVLVTSTSTVY